MPIVAMPDGTRVQFPDDMPEAEIRAMIQRKFPDTNPEIGGKAYQFARGAVQGAIYDPVEGIGQLIEHASGKKIPIPQSVRNWFDKVRENTEATGTGTAGRVTGSIGSLLVAPEVAGTVRAASIGYRAARMTGPQLVAKAQQLGRPETISRINAYATKLGKAPNRLTNDELGEALLTRVPRPPATGLARIARQAATGAAAGATQPVAARDDDDYWRQKAAQALAGGTLAGVAGSRLGEVGLRAARHHPWYTGAAVFHPGSSIPTLAILSGLAAQRGLERAGERVAAPIGAAAGRALGGEESDNAEAQQ